MSAVSNQAKWVVRSGICIFTMISFLLGSSHAVAQPSFQPGHKKVIAIAVDGRSAELTLFRDVNGPEIWHYMPLMVRPCEWADGDLVGPELSLLKFSDGDGSAGALLDMSVRLDLTPAEVTQALRELASHAPASEIRSIRIRSVECELGLPAENDAPGGDDTDWLACPLSDELICPNY